MASYFGVKMPELAIEGMLSSLEQIGFIKKNTFGKSAHYETEIDIGERDIVSEPETIEIQNTVERIYQFVVGNIKKKKLEVSDENTIKI